MPKPWETLSGEPIVRGPYVGLRKDTCRLPDGRIHDGIYILELPDWVQAFALTRDGRVVMVRQYRHGTGSVNTEFPAGCIEPGETPGQAAARELLEETGYRSDAPPVLIASAHTNPALTGNKIHVCLIRDAELTGSVDFDEFEEVECFTKSFDEVGGMIRGGEITHIHTRFAYDQVKKYLRR